uniref:Uncharacterized protein n=1 Tax=Plectus sambesii TaxID=2011161 RepID=A0A914V529_9BILA
MLLRPERRQRIRKEDISNPSNFVHIAHIGWDSRQLEDDSTPTQLPSALSSGSNTATGIVSEDVSQTPSRRPRLRPPPPIPCQPLQPPSVICSTRPTVETDESVEAEVNLLTSAESFFITAAEPPFITIAAESTLPEPSPEDSPSMPTTKGEIVAEVQEDVTPEIEILNIEESCTSLLDEPKSASLTDDSMNQPPEEDIRSAARVADLEAICLLLEGDLKRAKVTRDALKSLITCAICMTQRKSAALQPCGHTFCAECPQRFESSSVTSRRICPLCNQSYSSIVSFRL